MGFVDMLPVAFLFQVFQHDRRVGHKSSGLHRGDLVIVLCGVRDATKHAFVASWLLPLHADVGWTLCWPPSMMRRHWDARATRNDLLEYVSGMPLLQI